jgi:iron complex transport system substrate-binding protein
MNIRILLLTLVAALAFVFVACGDDDDQPSATATAAPSATTAASGEPFFDCAATPDSSTPAAEEFPVTVTDSAGTEVTIDAAPEKIVSLDAAHSQVLFAIGAGDQVVAVDNFSDCPAAATSLTHLDSFTPSLEAITAQDPDLVVLFFDAADIVESLRSAGIDVILQETPPNVAGIYADIETIGQATGHSSEANDLVAAMKSEIDNIEESVSGEDGPSVFHELDNTYFTVGDGSFVDDMYTLLGADNLGHGTGQAGPQLSSEAIIAANPEVIILADADYGESAETVATRPGWSEIAAVKNDRVVGVNANLVSNAGPTIVDAMRTLKALLYPDS